MSKGLAVQELSGCGEFIPDQKLLKITLNANYLCSNYLCSNYL